MIVDIDTLQEFQLK